MNVKLTPHGEHLLREYLAREPHRTPEQAIERALESLLEGEPVSDPPHRECRREEIRAWLNELAQFSDKIPPMPGETFSREMIYQDHD